MIRRLLVLVVYIDTHKKQSSHHPDPQQSSRHTLIHNNHPAKPDPHIFKNKELTINGEHHIELVSFGGDDNILKIKRTVNELPTVRYEKV